MSSEQHETPRLLRLKQVQERIPLSKSAIYAKAAGGTFPAPVKLSTKASAWKSTDIDAWIRSLDETHPK